MWNHLKPSTQRVLSLAAEVKTLENEREHLKLNLHRAEEEVKLLFDENNLLDEENKRLLQQYLKERNHPGSGGKHISSASAKGNKRKCSPKTHSPLRGRLISLTWNHQGSLYHPCNITLLTLDSIRSDNKFSRIA
ncbi:hypothetical protein CK203_022208 [Vitis vinifera]|uniref:Uncharacterized protein n=1 Tax=Vitis vinifera TaxID=29760 RepID=A0A438FZR0_VITVI|nr:hypothetical protein CK203_022208 [Vitis vinifera]